MKNRKLGKTRILKVFFIIALLITAGLSGYSIYGKYKINQISSMTFEEMIAYTTKDNKDALITIGIVQDGKMSYDVYGENSIKLLPVQHDYEIGSITKTFTTSLLCKAMSEEKIDLNHQIDAYLNLPEKDYYPTISRLLTHTSGYKEYYFESPMISNFLHNENSFYKITKDMFIERLGKISLKDSDYSFRYSNFGMSTIGLVLEEIYNKDYSSLINDYILNDLGLANTKISDGTGDLKNYWQWSESDAYLPAGALLSYITDMLSYAELHMNETIEYLQIAHETLANVSVSNEGYEKMGIHIDAVGAGWMIDNENNIIWHNGATSNYNSYIGFDKENKIGVIVLSNLSPSYRVPATIMGTALLISLQNTLLESSQATVW